MKIQSLNPFRNSRNSNQSIQKSKKKNPNQAPNPSTSQTVSSRVTNTDTLLPSNFVKVLSQLPSRSQSNVNSATSSSTETSTNKKILSTLEQEELKKLPTSLSIEPPNDRDKGKDKDDSNYIISLLNKTIQSNGGAIKPDQLKKQIIDEMTTINPSGTIDTITIDQMVKETFSRVEIDQSGTITQAEVNKLKP